jgi:two-component system response regulator YesN
VKILYNLLIVDDEPEIAEFLSDICSEIREYELQVYTAHSGYEALELLKVMRVDLILSDMKMPGMDGLQLLEQIQTNWNKCKVIFMTGYREFDYVYTAIQKGGIRYLLKTENDDTIREAVVSTIKEIEDSLKAEALLLKSKKYMQEFLPLLQEECFNDMVDGIEISSLNQERFDELSIPLFVDFPMIMFIGRLDNLSISQSEKYEYYTFLRNIISENIPVGLNLINTIHDHYYLICLAQPSKELILAEENLVFKRFISLLKDSLEIVQTSCKQTISHTVSFSIAEEPFLLKELPNKYEKLKKLLMCRIGMGIEMLLLDNTPNTSMLTVGSKKIQTILHAKFELLKGYLESGQKKEYFMLLHELCDDLSTIKIKDYNPGLEVYYNISMIILGFINKHSLATSISSKIGIYKLTRADEHSTWSEAVSYLMELSKSIFDILLNMQSMRAENVIDILKQYVKEHISEDLTLTALSGIVHFNPSYLSRLFKQETGISLSDYILSTKMEKAKYYLSDTNMKINEIALAVGYDLPHSFTRLFRNVTGLSPHDYRLINIKR